MSPITEMLLEKTTEEDLKNFFEETSNGDIINSNSVYLSHCVFIEENGIVTNEMYRIVIDSSLKEPHNKFFVDIISNEAIGIQGGWSGFQMDDNTGWCVDTAEPLSNHLHGKTVSLTELTNYVNDKNQTLNNKKIKAY